MTMINVLELCTKDQKSIEEFVDDVQSQVVDEGAQSFQSLDEGDQERMVALLIAALDESEDWFINLDDIDMITRSFAKAMRTHEPEDNDYALSLFKVNAIKYFKGHLDDFISIKRREYQAERINDYRADLATDEALYARGML